MGGDVLLGAAALVTGSQVGGYVVEERIGVGGFGEVYRARHPVIRREVAIKILHARYSADPDAVARFIAEARAVNTVSHPGIVEIYDFGKLPDGREFCVMELIRGRTLRDVLRDRTRLPIDEALPILRGIAAAVDAAHVAGIAHRDLKPDNVFVLADGSVKLIDFGLAKLTREDSAIARVTQTGAVFGTPLYMSPEQCRGKAITAATDGYSFGVLAYHVLTGEPPFAGDALGLALHHLNDVPEPPSSRYSELDDRVDRVVLALLAKDPRERPAPLVGAIDAIRGEGELPRIRRRRGRRIAWLGGGIAALAIPSAIFIQQRSRRPEVASLSCARASDRLAGVWDGPTRAAIQARFDAVPRPDVAGTWRAVALELDGHSAGWAKQWDAACAAPDAQSDPLLHAQRLTCLDDYLVHLRGATQAVATADIAKFAQGWGGYLVDVSLVDCSTTEVLRAQLPAPPEANRAEVARLMIEIQPWVQAAEQPGGLDAVVSHLEQVARRLEVLGSASANAAWTFRAFHFREIAESDPARRDEARQALAHSIERAEATRDDSHLALDYSMLASFELDAARLPEAEAALARGDAAAARSHDTGATIALDYPRIAVAASRGQLETALQLATALIPRQERFEAPDPSPFVRELRVNVLSRLGRHREAIADARQILALTAGLFGEDHMKTAHAHGLVEEALARSGDFAGALSEIEHALAIYTRLSAPAESFKELRLRQLFDAGRLGETGLAATAAQAIVRGELPADPRALTPAERLDLARTAISVGSIEVARDQLAKMSGSEPSTLRATADDLLGYLDLMTGDYTSMKHHLARVSPAPLEATSPDDSLRPAPWLLAIVDAVAGHGEGAAVPEARVALEHARATSTWSRDARLAEIDAWLGFARVEAGAPKAALEPLEESLDVVMSCCDGFHYFAPIAELSLARAIWDTDGDKSRARSLAEQARDHFARLGRFRDAERQAATRWLDEHPLP